MKRIFLILIAGLLVYLFPLVTYSREEALSLGKALEIARGLNPEVILSKHDTSISQAERLKANRYPNPEINFNIGPNYETLELEGTNENLYVSGSVSQEIELWGKRRLRKQIAKDQITLSTIQELITHQDVESKIKILYAAIQRAEERVSLIRSNVEITERFVGSAQMKFQQNEAPHVDVLRAKMELATQHKNLVLEQKDLIILKQQMNLALARDLDTPFHAGDPFGVKSALPSILNLLTKAGLRPEFQSIEVQKSQNQKEIRLAKQEAKPNLTTGFFIEKDSPDFHFGPSIGMEIPTWYRNKGEIETAKARLLKTEYQKTYLTQKVELEVKNKYLELKKIFESIRLQQEIIQSTGELFRMTFQSYQEGKTDFLRFLETLESVNRFKAEYYDTLFEYFVKRAELERAVGGNL